MGALTSIFIFETLTLNNLKVKYKTKKIRHYKVKSAFLFIKQLNIKNTYCLQEIGILMSLFI